MTIITFNDKCVCPLSVLESKIFLLYLLNERSVWLELCVSAVCGFFLELLHQTSDQQDQGYPPS